MISGGGPRPEPQPGMQDNEVREYRGQRFQVQTRGRGQVWVGFFHLLDVDVEEARHAAAAGRHQWKPMDPGWATPLEAQRNASEAAHAAIDAHLRRVLV